MVFNHVMVFANITLQLFDFFLFFGNLQKKKKKKKKKSYLIVEYENLCFVLNKLHFILNTRTTVLSIYKYNR